LILIFYAVATVFENGKSYAMNMLYGKNEELQHVIDKLKSTQQQLVQQEKLASLGQLTAGIAHEIKNPLNFVNNFSDLSIELIEEVREEIKNLEISSQNSEVFGILDDIETNLRKIYEHGSRADSIVKSMLQHSRGGDGITEPTDLNALVNEYVNLSFRGMRADKNQMNVDIELKLDESIGEVPLTTEDFSRVIVNLCNNGFDAMRGKLNSEEYTPKLTIRTHQTDTNIILEIEDNGPGIPEEIRDKIMQPFFTTKKGTEGTGLGLYITNDIVKAHGGDIKIVNGSEGALFIITLPKNR
jgi:signal transduction histidine kinase